MNGQTLPSLLRAVAMQKVVRIPISVVVGVIAIAVLVVARVGTHAILLHENERASRKRAAL